jgi:S1-C subfamily serine protease
MDFRKAIRSVALALLMPLILHAEDPAWVDALCTVTAGNARGTGVLVSVDDGVGTLLTNHHVVGRATKVVAKWENGFKSNGTVIWKDSKADQAVIQLAIPDGTATLPVATLDHRPRASHPVQVAGFGGTTGKLTLWNTTVNGYRASDSGRHEIEVDGNAISGDSGGAIVFDNKLVAVLWGGPIKGRVMYAIRGCIAEFATAACRGRT